jgi:hypothetical protein
MKTPRLLSNVKEAVHALSITPWTLTRWISIGKQNERVRTEHLNDH